MLKNFSGQAGFCSAARIAVEALFALLILCVPPRVTGQLFQVEKTVTPTDLYPSAPNLPMVLMGLSDAGGMAGYYIHHLPPPGTRQPDTYPHAFVRDAAALYDLNTALQAEASIATCMSPDGVVAGVGWSSGNPGISAPQFGFTWKQGVLQPFQSPDGSSIDAVVAVNNLGQAVGTYFVTPALGTGVYKHAFLWNGTASVDLGDFGDPDNSFVWPKAINNAGQIVGTVYHYYEGSGSTDMVAFLWQAGVIAPLDTNASIGSSSGIGINDLGEAAATYLAPNSTNPLVPIPSGFYWLDDVITTLGALAPKKALTPFAINNAGYVIGTAYAADSTLHLFSWQASAATTTTDLGGVALSAGDTAFRLTGINSAGNAVGFVTDASNHPQAVWRLASNTAGTMHNLASRLLASGVTFTADSSGGTSVLVNEMGRVACTGFNGTGQAVTLLLLPDSDADGLPDEWELTNNLNPFDGSDASADPDQDGLTNLEEFQGGTNPNDFYNGQNPTLAIVSGNNQTAAPMSFVPEPLIVKVTDSNDVPLSGALVTFAITSSGGQLQVSSNGSPRLTASLRCDIDGQAKIFFQTPGATNMICGVSAKITTANQPIQVDFTEGSNGGGPPNPSPTDPGNPPAPQEVPMQSYACLDLSSGVTSEDVNFIALNDSNQAAFAVGSAYFPDGTIDPDATLQTYKWQGSCPD